MLTALEDPKVLVLRLPEEHGNFMYRVAELSEDEASRWEEQLLHGESSNLPLDHSGVVSDPLTLPEVMDALQSRDFKVLDFPVSH